MSTRSALTVVGAAVGMYFGYPQLGLVVGGLVGSAVDPATVRGPEINEVAIQTQAEGVPRIVPWGTVSCIGNIIQVGPLQKTTEYSSQGKGSTSVETPTCYRTFAIAICEGPISAMLRVWEDNKLVYDMRAGSLMVAESLAWMKNKFLHTGEESQEPDPFLTFWEPDTPAYRGTAYLTFNLEDQTDRGGSFKQYRFEVAKEVGTVIGAYNDGPTSAPYPVFNTYLSVDDNENPFMLRQQTGSSGYEVSDPGSFAIDTFANGFTTGAPYASASWANGASGPGSDKRIWPIAFETRTNRALSYHGNDGYCMLLNGGNFMVNLKPTSGASDTWWYGESLYSPEYGGLAWFHEDVLYLGVRQVTSGIYNKIFRFALNGAAVATATSPLLMATSSVVFWMHVSRAGVVRAIAASSAGVVQQFDGDLVATSTFNVPAAIASRFPGPSALMAFGVDEARGWQAYLYNSVGLKLSVYDMAGTLIQTYSITNGSGSVICNRIVFTSEAIYIQNDKKTFMVDAPPTLTGLPTTNGAIAADIHDRCDIATSLRDVSELTEPVDGFSIAGPYTGADAINGLRAVHMFDKSDHGGKLWYPKRGKAVVKTLTIDDLTEVPDTSQREQAGEIPYKLNLGFQHAASGYAKVKATAPGTPSPDRRTTGEVSMDTAVVMNENKAAQVADMIYKVTLAEANGTIELSVPLYVGCDLADGDCIGLYLRGRTYRLRIEQMAFVDWTIKLTLKHDRQSAYTSSVTGIPLPPPTLPPSTLVGDTVLVVADISGRQDSEDDLHYLIAATGAMPAWYGATVQRSLDGGASFSTVTTLNSAARIGTLLDAIPSASEDYTDTTNVVRVQLYRTTQVIDSVSDTQFLSECGAFLLEKADGSFEVLQYRDAFDEGAGIFRLTTLHRGRLNSGVAAHSVGAKFVMLEDMTHVTASSAWIGQTLTHRAPSFTQPSDDAVQQSRVYVGRSQIEWPVASFGLSRSGNNVTAAGAARHRFGTDDAPVASINFQGYRVTIVGTSTVTWDQAAPTFTYDVSAIGGAVTVSVAPLNRITGAGPATSGAI